jgi:hypothetical protein
VEEGFIFKEHRNSIFCDSDPNKLLDATAEYEHPHAAVKKRLREE